MVYARLLKRDVTLKLRGSGAEDDHGNPTAVVTDLLVKGHISQHSGIEAQQGQVVGAGFRLFLAADAPVTGWDAVEVDGLSYEIVGAPWQVFSPRTGVVHHVEADIRRANT